MVPRFREEATLSDLVTYIVTPLSMPNLEAEASTVFNFLARRLEDGDALLNKQAHGDDDRLGLPTLDSRTQLFPSLFLDIIVSSDNGTALSSERFLQINQENQYTWYWSLNHAARPDMVACCHSSSGTNTSCSPRSNERPSFCFSFAG